VATPEIEHGAGGKLAAQAYGQLEIVPAVGPKRLHGRVVECVIKTDAAKADEQHQHHTRPQDAQDPQQRDDTVATQFLLERP